VGDILSLGKKTAAGAELQVRLTSGRSANTRFARSEITSTGDVDETRVGIQLAYGKRHAAIDTNQTDPASLRTALETASRMARLAPEDPEYMPVLGTQRYLAAAPEYDDATARLGAQERAAAIKAAIDLADGKQLESSGFYVHETEATALGTSAGQYAYHVFTSAEFTTTMRAPSASGSGWAGALSHRVAELDARALAQVAVDKAVRSMKPQPLAPGRYTVVLEPAAVGELLLWLARSLDARRADEGRSYFARKGGGTRLGEKLFADGITLRSDPFQSATPGLPFDNDGLALKPTIWIDNGTLSALSYSRYWAQKQGKSPTGAPRALQLQGGKVSASEQLLSGVKKGLLITRFWYTRMVDPQTLLITGLTRDGVFLIEDGQVTTPVNNFRFNESPVTMLRNADALMQKTPRIPGDSESRLWAPALRTHDFQLASVSDAV
jgi:predicted Zn-dependent protease